jgi:signal transduction histidine kinase
VRVWLLVCLIGCAVAAPGGFGTAPFGPFLAGAVACFLFEVFAVKLFPFGFFSSSFSVVLVLAAAYPAARGWACGILALALLCRVFVHRAGWRETLADAAPALCALAPLGFLPSWQLRVGTAGLVYIGLGELCQRHLSAEELPDKVSALQRSRARFRPYRWFLVATAPALTCVQQTGTGYALLGLPLLAGLHVVVRRELKHLHQLLGERLLRKQAGEIDQAEDELARTQAEILLHEASQALLFELTGRLSGAHDVLATAEATLEALQGRVPFRRAGVFAFDEDEVLRPVFWRGSEEPPPVPEVVEQQLGVWRSWLKRKTGEFPSTGHVAQGPLLVWPLGAEGALLLEQSPHDPVTPEHLYLLALSAGQATLGMQSARRFREQRDAEATVLQTSKMAAVGQLAAGVAHELNTPLAAVQLQLELVELQSDLAAEATQALERAGAAVGEAQSIIDRLLLYSREGPSTRLPSDLNQIVLDTVEMLRSQIELEGVHIVTELNESCRGIVNANEMQQVLMSLLLRGKDACLHPEARGRQVLVRSRSSAAEIEVDVHDQGVPIAPSIRHRIFDPFLTGPAAGLGLAVSAELVSQHGGSLQVLVGVDPWTTVFRLRLPRAL